ncbi:RUN and FYVE domain-containing protein 4-like isoform X2 [Meriones unguiculatus]|uniref:RUN and FYVE domain-containing protein 4-like isoform X2 n=1 Tax=Meriones unguiculatus TaxID=10047 RepID=UPI000B4F359F|nr:RUN and FYVE domain-containing protein 4-like isoform X2 [Meriones unguiculatus]
MAEKGTILNITRNLKNAVSAILQGYGDRQGPLTDTSVELHRLCGCLELLLQFDQKEQRSFLGARKDYWDFLFTALRQQRRYTEQTSFVCSQDKLKTSLGKGRAFIRLCLAHGQLADSMQLCLLNPELTREWYGPQSPLLCPELQEDILDTLYALNGVAFNLDLQRPDLDEAWPMFSESNCSSPSQTQERRARKPKCFPKEVRFSRGEQLQALDTRGTSCLHDAMREVCPPDLPTPLQHGDLPTFLEEKKEDLRSLRCSQSIWEAEREEFLLDQKEGDPKTGQFLPHSTASSQQQRDGAKEAQQEVTRIIDEGKGSLPGTEGQRTTKGIQEKATDWDHDQGLLALSLHGRAEDTKLGTTQGWDQPCVLGQTWVLQCLGTKKGSTPEKPQEWTRVTSASMQGDQAEVPLQQEVIKDPKYKLQLEEEQVQCQEQLPRAQKGELQVLQEQLSRCQTERAQLQAMLEHRQQETERRNAMYEKELEVQRDLIQAMKRRVLELIHEKDHQWQRLQKLSTVAPGHCVGCNKVFRRLSRRYPCRLCGGLVCHACSVDYKKRERCCPACAQREEIQNT